jgi:hypothetical protein
MAHQARIRPSWKKSSKKAIKRGKELFRRKCMLMIFDVCNGERLGISVGHSGYMSVQPSTYTGLEVVEYLIDKLEKEKPGIGRWL